MKNYQAEEVDGGGGGGGGRAILRRGRFPGTPQNNECPICS